MGPRPLCEKLTLLCGGYCTFRVLYAGLPDVPPHIMWDVTSPCKHLHLQSASSKNSDGASSPGSGSKYRPSLSRILLSLETPAAKQQALTHVLNALKILYARDAIIAALERQQLKECSATSDSGQCLTNIRRSSIFSPRGA